MNMKKLQIGIMGSAADLNYSNDALNFAKELGKLIAKSGNILVYGALFKSSTKDLLCNQSLQMF